MNRTRWALTLLGLALGLLVSRPATAKHPVKEIPVMVVRMQPDYGWTTRNAVERQIEFANRVYANAGIQFKFDPATVFMDVWDDDLNCWYDDVADDEATASWYAESSPEEIVTLVHYRMARAVNQPCVWSDCLVSSNCCPGTWNADEGRCAFDVACIDYPGYPGAPFGVCGPTTLQGPGTDCFGSNCSTQTCNITGDWRGFLRFVPLTNNPAIYWFAHEVGHHFGLAHTFDPPAVRCYDQGYGTPAPLPEGKCGSGGGWPDTPVLCSGQYYSCGSLTPYRNIMSYYTDCNARYAGEWSTSTWNVSLSQGQIAIIRRSLDEYWDRDLVNSIDGRLFKYGGYEMMQRAATGAREYRGYDYWNFVLYSTVGDGGWGIGNVRITQGDFNGDGNIDAIVYTSAGSHPGTTLWLRQGYGGLVYTATFLNASYGASVVTVGNFQGDGADDALIQTSVVAYAYRGGIGASSLTYSLGVVWPHTTHKVAIGNFSGAYELASPMPYGAFYEKADKHQDAVNASPPTWNNISYDDVIVLTPTNAQLYLGHSQLSFATAALTTTSYNNSAPGVWAGNTTGDYHDELLIRSGDYVRILRGKDAFSFSDQVGYIYQPSSRGIVISMGDFSGDLHADFLLTAATDGTRLYLGDVSTVLSSSWYRPDLVYANTRHAVADFARGGRDDVMFYTTAGSFLYAGKPSPTFLASDVWSDTSIAYPSIEWFGRR